MILFHRPGPETVSKFLRSQAWREFTYSAVGATRAMKEPPTGFVVDHTRIQLGHGQRVFETAKRALMRWEQFRLGWVEAHSDEERIQPGNHVAVLAHQFGLHWLNACRVIYVVDETGPVSRYGYAYGTLPDHPAIGEERFLVEWNPADGGVWYDILAFSRPRGIMKVGYRWMRAIQKRFGKDSAAAMVRAAGNHGGLETCKGKLLFLCGKMAAGKSTLSRKLAERENSVLLAQDEFLERLFPGEIVDIPAFLKCSSRLHDALGPHICLLLSKGISVVLDFPGNTRSQRAWFRHLFEASGAGHELHFIDASDDLCKRQLKERSKGLPAGTAWTTDAEFDAITAYFEPPSIEEHFNIIWHERV
jgi:uncharacterized protein (UPF0548 family)/predicted kinase